MGTSHDNAPLRRKAQAGRQTHQARAMSVPKALRVAMAKSADSLFDMALSVIGATTRRCAAEGLEQEIDAGALLLLLDGPDRRVGAALLAPTVVGALIQQQTTGRVTPDTAVDQPRAMTATDAALVAPLIDALFSRAAPLLETATDRALLGEYRFGSRAEGERLLLMALEAQNYEVVRLTLDVAAGARQGMLTLILPVLDPHDLAPTGTAAAPGDQDRGPARSGEQPRSRAAMSTVAMQLPTDLTAALCRIRLTVGKLGRLAPGDVLDLPADAFAQTCVTTSRGRVLSAGVLGQVDGKRAVRLVGLSGAARRGAAQGAGGMDLPDLGQGAAPATATATVAGRRLPQSSGLAAGPAEDLETALDLSGIPDLDLPDLPELPATDDIMPDMSDLPELDDLPSLDDLPKINIA